MFCSRFFVTLDKLLHLGIKSKEVCFVLLSIFRNFAIVKQNRGMTGTYILAGTTTRIDSVHAYVHDMCRDYKAPAARQEELTIHTTQEDIERERAESEKERLAEGLPPCRFDDGYIESLCVYRKISTEMALRHNTMLMHGSAIAVDGNAYMITAASGTGKSTHTRLWRELYGHRAVMINDDKPLVKVLPGLSAENPDITIYGTPWNGKHGIGTNTSAPLKAICILERGDTNEVCRLEAAEAYAAILSQTFRPKDITADINTYRMMAYLVENIGVYRIRCNMDINAAKTVSRAIGVNP